MLLLQKILSPRQNGKTILYVWRFITRQLQVIAVKINYEYHLLHVISEGKLNIKWKVALVIVY